MAPGRAEGGGDPALAARIASAALLAALATGAVLLGGAALALLILAGLLLAAREWAALVPRTSPEGRALLIGAPAALGGAAIAAVAAGAFIGRGPRAGPGPGPPARARRSGRGFRHGPARARRCPSPRPAA